jgi:hypothetical protein
VNKIDFKKSVYKIRVKWTNQKQLYYIDENIFIQ